MVFELQLALIGVECVLIETVQVLEQPRRSGQAAAVDDCPLDVVGQETVVGHLPVVAE